MSIDTLPTDPGASRLLQRLGLDDSHLPATASAGDA